jgi:hypothetical protein
MYVVLLHVILRLVLAYLPLRGLILAPVVSYPAND